MIYSRFGEPVAIVREATEEDVRKDAGGGRIGNRRRPLDKADIIALAARSYWIVRFADGGEQLYHLAYLRADGGAKEVCDEIEKLGRATVASGNSARAQSAQNKRR